MSEEKMRASFEECVKETECLLMVDEDTAFDIFRYAYKAALKFVNTNSESEAGAVVDIVYVCPNAKGKYRAEVLSDERLRQGAKLYLAPPSAQAIETAAIMKCWELVKRSIGTQYETGKREIDDPDHLLESLLALIPQDGRTQLCAPKSNPCYPNAAKKRC